MGKFSVVWKGKKIARLSRDEIRHGFERGTYGVLHSVRLENGSLLSVPDFLENSAVGHTADENSGRDFSKFDFATCGFVLCGLSFVSPYVFLGLFVYALFLFASKRIQLAGILLLLGALMLLAGMAFFWFVGNAV